jgi:hypothetical protein
MAALKSIADDVAQCPDGQICEAWLVMQSWCHVPMRLLNCHDLRCVPPWCLLGTSWTPDDVHTTLSHPAVPCDIDCLTRMDSGNAILTLGNKSVHGIPPTGYKYVQKTLEPWFSRIYCIYAYTFVYICIDIACSAKLIQTERIGGVSLDIHACVVRFISFFIRYAIC